MKIQIQIQIHKTKTRIKMQIQVQTQTQLQIHTNALRTTVHNDSPNTESPLTSSWPNSMLGRLSNSWRNACQKSSKATSSYPRVINDALLKNGSRHQSIHRSIDRSTDRKKTGNISAGQQEERAYKYLGCGVCAQRARNLANRAGSERAQEGLAALSSRIGPSY